MSEGSSNLITHVLYSGLGGHSAVLFSLLEGGFLAGMRHRVLFVGVEPPPLGYLRRCKNLDIPWRYISKDSGEGSFSYIFNLQRELVSNDPNILFLHGVSAVPSVVIVKLLKLHKAPFVIIRETQANNLKSRREWFFLLLAHWFGNRVVHLTEEALLGTRKRIGYLGRWGKVSIIPNAIDTDFFIPNNTENSKGDKLNIGMQSRLQSNKDHSTLIKAFAIVCERYPDKKLHLHIAGDGATYINIKNMIASHGLSAHITMHGMLGQRQLREFLQNLDIYIHCTHGETMSTAIMQALSCGLPLIASDVPGVSNMVTPEAGVLYVAGDEVSLADKLSDLIIKKERCRELQSSSRNYVLKRYSISRLVNSYESLLSKEG